MTPLRMLVHLGMMLDNLVETPATIRIMANKYKVAANANKDYDIEWYANEFIVTLDALAMATPAWTSAEIKQQLRGRLSTVIPGNS